MNGYYQYGIYLISKTAVPIFFMISGAIHLKKDYSHKTMIKKVIFRILVPLIVCSLLIYFKNNFEITFENLIGFLVSFLRGNIMQQYWFLYTLAGLYIATPFIRKMILKFEKNDYLYFLGLWIMISGVIPIVQHYTKITITSSFKVPIISGYLGYYILGHYIFNFRKIDKNKKYLIINVFSLLLITSISVYATYLDYIKNNYSIILVFLDKLNYISIIIPTMNIVYIFMYVFTYIDINEKMKKIIIEISSTTFGVYLFHGVFLEKFKIIYKFINIYISNFFATIITQIIIFAIMIVIVKFVKKIPILKKII